MKRLILTITTAFVLLISINSSISAAVGDDVIGPINLPADIPYASDSDEAENELRSFVRGGIRIAFIIGLVGVLIFFSIGGIRWIFSGGDKQKVEQAKSMITAAIVGFAILALSYLILFLIGTFFGIDVVQSPEEKPGECISICGITPHRPLPNGDSCTDTNAVNYCDTTACPAGSTCNVKRANLGGGEDIYRCCPL